MNIVQAQTETSTTAVLTSVSQNQVSMAAASEILANINSTVGSYVKYISYVTIGTNEFRSSSDQQGRHEEMKGLFGQVM